MSDGSRAGAVLEVTDADFAAEIEGAGGVSVVDFGAAWCGPCKMMNPIVEQLAGELAGQVRIAKIDVDANPRTAARYNARSLPTFLVFRDGQVVHPALKPA